MFYRVKTNLSDEASACIPLIAGIHLVINLQPLSGSLPYVIYTGKPGCDSSHKNQLLIEKLSSYCFPYLRFLGLRLFYESKDIDTHTDNIILPRLINLA